MTHDETLKVLDVLKYKDTIWNCGDILECLIRHIKFQEEKRVNTHLRQARALGLPATLTIEQWMNTLEHFSFSCAYCMGRYELLEHYIPVSLGGGTTEDNCVPACQRCNVSKRNKHPYDIIETNPTLEQEKEYQKHLIHLFGYLANRRMSQDASI